MIRLCCVALFAVLCLGCRKEVNDQGSRVAIYLLESFKVQQNTITHPARIMITDAVLTGEPLVRNEDIAYYTSSTATFKLLLNIRPLIVHLGSDKGFAVTVDDVPVYYGKFHPAYLSSITFGLATIDPVLVSGSDLPIHFATIQDHPQVTIYDQRNDPRILAAFRASGRLR